MHHYSARLIGQDGRFIRSIALSCIDDEAAVESAKQLVDGHDVELWQRDRRVTRLSARTSEVWPGRPPPTPAPRHT